MSNDNLIEIPKRKEIKYQGKYLEYHLDEVILPDGRTSTREYLHHPGAIAAVPLLDDGQVVMVKQFRYPTGSVLLEIPAGKLEAGETPDQCVERELIEEIGYKPDQISHLISIWTTPGFTDEIIHLYLATGLKPCRSHLDSDEFLEVVVMTKEELLDHLHSGAVVDGKTSLALFILEARKLW
jgi:ADP-ribose pyrophosphatase